MIVKCDGKEYLVLSLEFRDSGECLVWGFSDTESAITANIENLIIVDARLPEMCVIRGYYDSFGNCIISDCLPEMSILGKNKAKGSFIELIDKEIYDYPNIKDCWGNKVPAFNDDLENGIPKAMLVFYRTINRMKAFHGLPLMDLSEWEEAVRKQEEAEEKNRPESEEERRKRELNDELDEYLRIGEELSKAKEAEEK